VRILLDENLGWRLGRELQGHVVDSVPLIGWAGLQNSLLLGACRERIRSVDYASSSFQQDLAKYGIALVVLKAPTNRLADTRRPLMSKVRALLPTLKPGMLTVVSA
jgi:hypothetical protein